MTFVQILVLVVVVCISVMECVNVLAKASVMKKRTGVPPDSEIAQDIIGAMIQADNTGAMVRICFSDHGTEIIYTPGEMLDEPVQDGD